MKNTKKFLEIIVLIVLIGFMLNSCGEKEESSILKIKIINNYEFPITKVVLRCVGEFDEVFENLNINGNGGSQTFSIDLNKYGAGNYSGAAIIPIVYASGLQFDEGDGSYIWAPGKIISKGRTKTFTLDADGNLY